MELCPEGNTNPAPVTMLAGKMLGAYSVTPAEPVSKINGMLTGTVPTVVAITTRRGTELADWLGYRFMTTGCSITPLTTLEPEEEPPPQLLRPAAMRPAAERIKA